MVDKKDVMWVALMDALMVGNWDNPTEGKRAVLSAEYWAAHLAGC